MIYTDKEAKFLREELKNLHSKYWNLVQQHDQLLRFLNIERHKVLEHTYLEKTEQPK
jgi:DNA-binding transcriptional regulator PaaX